MPTNETGTRSSSDRHPLVTVVVPVWDDYVVFLPEAVGSVRRDATETPIVVVDNASATPVPTLDGITVVHAPRRLSVGAARNLGLDQVGTEYVLFLDADDMLLEGTLDFLLSALEQDRSVAVAATSILDGRTGRRHRTPRSFVPRLARRPFAFALADCVWSLYPIQSCAMFKTADARDAGGYPDADWGDDWVLAVSLALRGRVEISERLGRFYRATTGSLAGRPKGASELVASARLVRERLRSDAATPRSIRLLLPAIALLQLVAVYAVRPAYLGLRGRRGSRSPMYPRRAR